MRITKRIHCASLPRFSPADMRALNIASKLRFLVSCVVFIRWRTVSNDWKQTKINFEYSFYLIHCSQWVVRCLLKKTLILFVDLTWHIADQWTAEPVHITFLKGLLYVIVGSYLIKRICIKKKNNKKLKKTCLGVCWVQPTSMAKASDNIILGCLLNCLPCFIE